MNEPVIVPLSVAQAIEDALSPKFFNGNKEQLLQIHKSKDTDPWGRTLSALNSISFDILQRALLYGYKVY